jgi:hypothetical protein
MALWYKWACKNGTAKCVNGNSGATVHDEGNCHGQTKPECGLSSSRTMDKPAGGGNNPKTITQGSSGKYYCKMPGGTTKICIQEGQPTGATCNPLPPTGESSCSYGGMTGYIVQDKTQFTYKASSKFKGFMGGSVDPKSGACALVGGILGAVVARKFIKKGDKNLNTAIGGAAGLVVGYGLSKLIK